MTYAEISKSVSKIKKKYGETDPFLLCEAMGIRVLFQNMGSHESAVKGFFLESNRIRVITINSELPKIVQRIIAAHELCHAINHRKNGIYAFHELALFDQNSELERDANLFAAELLLEDEEVLEVLNGDVTFFSAAAILCVPTELLDFKFRVMKWKGYKLTQPPINARSDFLKDMEVSKNGGDF